RLAGRPAAGGVAARAGDARAFRVEFVDQVLQVVVGLADRGGVEGVGLDHVRAGVQVIGVDLRDHVGAGQRQQVVVSLQVVALARTVAGRLQAVETFGERSEERRVGRGSR